MQVEGVHCLLLAPGACIVALSAGGESFAEIRKGLINLGAARTQTAAADVCRSCPHEESPAAGTVFSLGAVII
jgi:hypothetical protein